MSKVLCTIANDKFVNGLIVTISSFLDHNDFNGDIIVFINKEYSNISDTNKQIISSKISKEIIYKEIDNTDYIELINYFILKSNGKSNMLRLIPSIFTFSSFDLCEKYDQVLYLDSDMLVRASVMELFDIKIKGIYVTPALTDYKPDVRSGEFNGGFLFLNKLGKNEIKNELISTGLIMDDITLFDQPILNKTLSNIAIYLSCDYNCGKRMFPDFKFNQINNNVKIIHYVGAKPWDTNKLGFERYYRLLENLWFEKYNNTPTLNKI
jgi:lipopolysaccharide biosynthesis glycosyltransferase